MAMAKSSARWPIGHGLYLIGPVIEHDDGAAHFVAAFGGARSFTVDHMVVPADDDPHAARAAFLRTAKNGAFGEGGAEAFDDEHALLIRAAAIWPNGMTKRALAEFEKSMAIAERLDALAAERSRSWWLRLGKLVGAA
jgi:hypothetical protein